MWPISRTACLPTMNIKKGINLIKRLTPYNISKGVKYLKHFGLKEFLIRLSDRTEPEEVPYEGWFEANKASQETLAYQRSHQPKEAPLISIAVPLYRTGEQELKQLVRSVRAQSFQNWELCLADGSGEGEDASQAERRHALLKLCEQKDPRIKVRILEENRGISGNTNAAAEMASGAYLGLLDHDDLLAPDALYEIASAIAANDGPDLLYTDEDKVSEDGSRHMDPNLKPDFNPDLLRSNNYICHFLVLSARLWQKCGGLDPAYDGAQDHDLVLRATEMADGIVHVPKVLYHWRVSAASTSDNPLSKEYAYEAGRRAVQAQLDRLGIPGTCERRKDFGFYRVRYQVRENPLVSIIIPNKDETETLKTCLKSILEKTTWPSYEILIIENNSTTEEIFSYYREIDGRNGIRVVYWNKAFNYSAINNYGASLARGDYLLFLNNDMELISPGWLEEMIGHCQRPGTGAVGARLYFPDGTIQHAGIAIGIGGIAASLFAGMKGSHSGYLHKAQLQQDLSAVTAACMMVSRSLFLEVGGFEEKLAVAFNDVDFCLRLRERGLLVVYDPYVELYHYESRTRGTEDSPEKVRRFQQEIEFMRTRWESLLKKGDPYYNPGFSRARWDYTLKSF